MTLTLMVPNPTHQERVDRRDRVHARRLRHRREVVGQNYDGPRGAHVLGMDAERPGQGATCHRDQRRPLLHLEQH